MDHFSKKPSNSDEAGPGERTRRGSSFEGLTESTVRGFIIL